MEEKIHSSTCRLAKKTDYLSTEILARSVDIRNLCFSTAEQITDDILTFTNLTSLNVAHCHLREIPEALFKLITLESIDMSCNSLNFLHPNIGKLTKLKKLILNSSALTKLPNSIGSLSELKVLHVKDNSLTKLPETIGNLSELQHLDVSENELTHLPNGIGDLKNLERMILRRNSLQELPAGIEQLKELSYLDISRNRLLKYLPGNIGQLVKLKHLDLSDNQLKSLPDTFGLLQMLQLVDLSFNQLRHLPESFGNLQELLLLSLSWNWLSTLPDSMGNLRNLKVLCVRNNNFQALPMAVTKLTALRILDFSNGPSHFDPFYANDIGLTYEVDDIFGFDEHHDEDSTVRKYKKKIFPFSLRTKKVSKTKMAATTAEGNKTHLAGSTEYGDTVIQRNEMSELPAQMTDLLLEQLYLNGNPMIRPPYEICREGARAVLQYLKYINERSKMVCADCVSMLGDTGAGKTSIVRSLQHGVARRTATEDRTRVLDQVEVTLKAFSTNFNDFGGHDIYQTVLPIFLPPDGISILAYDMTLPLSEQEDTVRQWLLTAFSRSPGTRVIVVGTHADLIDAEQRLQLTQHMSGFLKTLLNVAKEEISAHSSVVASSSSSCESQGPSQQRVSYLAERLRKLGSLDLNFVTFACDGDSAQRDLELLKNTLFGLIKPKIVLPEAWCCVIEDIVNPQTGDMSRRLFLTWDIVVDIGRRHLKEDQNFEVLQVIMQYLMATSQIIWLRQHVRLGKIIFHNVKRLVDACRTVLHHDHSPHLLHSFFEEDIEQYNKGKLSRRLLEHFLRSLGSDIEPLVELMIEFNLICPGIEHATDANYLIPCRLPDVVPQDLVDRIQSHQHSPSVRISLLFKCTVIPLAFFETSMASLLSMFHVNGAAIAVWKNGLAARRDGATVVYRRSESTIIIQVTSEATLLQMWKLAEPVLKKVTEYIIRMWKGAMPCSVFACPGCAYLRSPEVELYPSGRRSQDLNELRFASALSQNHWYCSTCQLDIPTTLVSPQNSEEIDALCEERTASFLRALAQKCVVCTRMNTSPSIESSSEEAVTAHHEDQSVTNSKKSLKKKPSTLESELYRRFRRAVPHLNKQLDKSTIVEILDQLFADEQLSADDTEDIRVKKTSTKMARKLTDLILRRGDRVIHAFLQALDSVSVGRNDLVEYVRSIPLVQDNYRITGDRSPASASSEKPTVSSPTKSPDKQL